VTAGWRRAGIEGVFLRTLSVHPDERGSFIELWRSSWFEGLPAATMSRAMRQANVSRSSPGVLRGLHVHRRQADMWVVLDGHPTIALVDIRPALGGEGAPVALTREAAPGDAIYIPEGVAHGFYAHDAITLVYFVTNEYDGTDELGFAWNDPHAGVLWPDGAPLLSARDAGAPPLADLLSRLQGGTVVAS
jgi:dTDP-4-dehydrorhamnose 3,5-epimerase